MNPIPDRRDRGFTLVEIIAVLAVMAAVLAIAIPAIAKVLQNGRIRNAEGTANAVRSAVAAYLSKPGSLGSIPVTESALTSAPVLPSSEWTGTATYDTAAAAKAATLDNVLLVEGVLDRPLALRMGEQNFTIAAAAVPVAWNPATATFSSSAAPTVDYSAASRVEGAVSDGVSDPGVTGAAGGSASCAFNLAGNGVLIPAGGRVAYLIIKAVPDADAYQLALDVDGPALLQNTLAAPAALDQVQGPVVYAKDPGTGFVDVYYYLLNI
jgi:prepilin-type N-terminal cleavage/methylation domain-containing protein